MIMFIVWNYRHDAAVRAAYESATQESIQEDPECIGQWCMVASSRATTDQLGTIPNITFGTSPESAGWVFE